MFSHINKASHSGVNTRCVSDLCEESLLWLPHHSSFTVGGILESRHKGPGAEGQPVLLLVVSSLMNGNERSSVQNHSGERRFELLGCTEGMSRIHNTDPQTVLKPANGDAEQPESFGERLVVEVIRSESNDDRVWF